MRLRLRPRGRLAIVAVAVVLLLTGGIALAAALRQPVGVTVRAVRIGVVDGPRGNQHVVLDASFFTPAGQGRLPAILLAPGFGETKYAVAPEAGYLARAGFAVLTWSPRGTGASGGQIGLDAPDYEVRDTSQLVTWLARQPRVLLDRPGDPRVGITGASYGGGLALLAAILSSHLLAEVEQTCSHVVVMNQGRRVAAGPVADIVGDGAALLVGTTEADRAVSVLRGLTGIDSVHARADGVQVQPNGVPASAVVAALVGAGIPVDRVGPSRRLEDAFLALIDGTAADVPGPDAPAPEEAP